jgi:hypothetical protein
MRPEQLLFAYLFFQEPRANSPRKTGDIVIQSVDFARRIPLFLDLNHRGIPRFARNDGLEGFFRNLLNAAGRIICGTYEAVEPFSSLLLICSRDISQDCL